MELRIYLFHEVKSIRLLLFSYHTHTHAHTLAHRQSTWMREPAELGTSEPPDEGRQSLRTVCTQLAKLKYHAEE